MYTLLLDTGGIKREIILTKKGELKAFIFCVICHVLLPAMNNERTLRKMCNFISMQRRQNKELKIGLTQDIRS